MSIFKECESTALEQSIKDGYFCKATFMKICDVKGKTIVLLDKEIDVLNVLVGFLKREDVFSGKGILSVENCEEFFSKYPKLNNLDYISSFRSYVYEKRCVYTILHNTTASKKRIDKSSIRFYSTPELIKALQSPNVLILCKITTGQYQENWCLEDRGDKSKFYLFTEHQEKELIEMGFFKEWRARFLTLGDGCLDIKKGFEHYFANKSKEVNIDAPLRKLILRERMSVFNV